MSKKKKKAISPNEPINEAVGGENLAQDANADIANAPKPDEKQKGEKKASIRDLDDHIKEALDDALDENVENLTSPETEVIATQPNISLKQVGATIFGFFVLIFAIIGIVSSAIFISDYVKSQSDDTKLINTFETLTLPFAACDAAAFEDVSVLSEDVMITVACWDAILNPSSTFAEESGYYTVSYLDIDVRIAKLFGTGLTYTHKSVGDSEINFEYNENTGMYTLPAYPKLVSYLSVLESYTETENGYELRVKYVYPVTSIITGSANAEKIMIFNAQKHDLGYIITSLEIGELVTGEEL